MAAVQSLPPEERSLYSRLHQILNQPGLILGSLLTMRRSCGKVGCRCGKGPRGRHRSLYLAVRIGRKRRLLYVPSEWESRVSEWVSRCQDIRRLLAEISKSFVRRLVDRQDKSSRIPSQSRQGIMTGQEG